jgi:predicted MPP superfamily phosphohydrolase
MTKVTILHVSDLHWSGAQETDTKLVVEALFADLRLLRDKGIAPDIVVFSGDLAQSGESKEQLLAGFNQFLSPLLETLGLERNRLVVCPGNHDIARSVVRGSQIVEAGLAQKLKSLEEINSFLDAADQATSETKLALERVQNFYEAHDEYFGLDTPPDPLCRYASIEIGGTKVGIAALNSTWRATGEADDIDKGRLIIGERSVDKAIAAVRDADLSIAVFHHPLEWLAEVDASSISNRILSTFDLVCCGHTHTSNPELRVTASGACIFSQTGSVYYQRKWFNGYQVIEIDLDTFEYHFTIREYHDRRREFDVATTVCRDGKITLRQLGVKCSDKTSSVETFLRSKREAVRAAAAMQACFIKNDDERSPPDIKEPVYPLDPPEHDKTMICDST